MVNLIKAGAFDEFGDRVEIMHQYVNEISDAKKRITLQNMKMLIEFGLIPDEYDLQRRVYNFNKYIKKLKLNDKYYGMDNIAFNFFSNNFDIDMLIPADTESGFAIAQIKWDTIYKKQMDIIRPFIQKHQAELLEAVNDRLTEDVWNKYCLGSISKWEMDSISCYIHEHELINVDMKAYKLENFFDLPTTPEVERYIPIKGKLIPILKLHRIIGTVLDRDKAKKMVTLLTTEGVVTVKIYGGVFNEYDKQLSEKRPDGTKKIIRKSECSRGNKIIVIGVRDDDSFRAKKYSKTPYHLIETVGAVEGSRIIIDNRNGDIE
jgi:DNA polymerase-3 subunit alpha